MVTKMGCEQQKKRQMSNKCFEGLWRGLNYRSELSLMIIITITGTTTPTNNNEIKQINQFMLDIQCLNTLDMTYPDDCFIFHDYQQSKPNFHPYYFIR